MQKPCMDLLFVPYLHLARVIYHLSPVFHVYNAKFRQVFLKAPELIGLIAI